MFGAPAGGLGVQLAPNLREPNVPAPPLPPPTCSSPASPQDPDPSAWPHMPPGESPPKPGMTVLPSVPAGRLATPEPPMPGELNGGETTRCCKAGGGAEPNGGGDAEPKLLMRCMCPAVGAVAPPKPFGTSRFLAAGHLGLCFTTQRHVKLMRGPVMPSSRGTRCW